MIDTFLLSRLQFALNISFHILFPMITIALCWYLCYFKVRWHLSGDAVWMRAYRFWVKVFALTFALGIVSGVTMSFQFGTNWPGFMATVGNIAGPLLGYEVLTAFFLEATFLGIMLFGMDRISARWHTLATFIVALGTTASAFWILALNSWMQTPAGFEMREGVAYPVSWMEIIFNASLPYRFAHTLAASALTATFLVAGISAYRLLKGDEKRAPRLTLKTSLIVASALVPLQVFIGDLHGLNTLQHQPQKVAAMEGIWETEKAAPLRLIAWPDEATRRNLFEITVPNLASIILTHDAQGEIRGLNEFRNEHPPVAPLFWGFRIMVGVGLLMLLVAWFSTWQWFRRKNLHPITLKILVAMTFSGWVATLAGWYVTEIGRQPYLVSGVLRTADAVTTVPAHNVALTLSLYVIVYSGLLVAYLHTLFLMARRSVEIEEISDAEQHHSASQSAPLAWLNRVAVSKGV